jgi:tetratricopeptide (TPR) repeat protein
MHPEIEKLIDLALADGQITEKERKVILKKANEFGVDSDEVDMILDAKLHQIQTKNKISDKIEEIKKCPSCGNVISGLSKTCICGYVINSGNINEVKSLETAIESLENLIVEIRTLKNNPNKIIEERITAKIEKEIRYIKVRYGDDLAVKKLINELEELSNNSLYTINKKRRKRKNRLLVIFTLIILSIGFFLYRIITFKTPEQKFNSDVIEKYESDVVKYKKSKNYKMDSILFYKSFENTFWNNNINYDKINIKFPSSFKFYILAREYEMKKDFEKSNKYIDTCLALYPRFAPIYFRKTYSNILPPDSLLVNINKAIDLNPNNKNKFLLRRGEIYLNNMENYELAYQDFKEAISNLKKSNFETDYNMLRCLIGLKDYINTKELYSELKVLYPAKVDQMIDKQTQKNIENLIK